MGRFFVTSLAVATSAPLAAQGFASAAGKVTIEMPVGATVINGVLNQAPLPTLGPVLSAPAVPSGSSAVPGVVLPAEAGPAPGSGQGNLITVFSNGGAQLVSDTAISVRVAPVGLQDLGGELRGSLEGQAQGSVMVIAQFN